MPNTSTPTTDNRNYPMPGDPTENTYPFAQERINDGIEAIDEDVQGIVDDIESLDENTTLGLLQTQFTRAFSSPTYDGNGKITAYTSENIAVTGVTYSDGKITGWTETLTTDGSPVVRVYTVAYSGDNVSSIGYT